MLPPGPLIRQRRRPPGLPPVKDRGRDNERPEKQDLHEQTPHHHLLPRVLAVRAPSRQQPSPAGLHEEREHVPANEDLGEPFAPDKERVVAVDHENDAAQLHVDACGEEGRGDEDEDALDDEGAEGVGAGVLGGGENAADVADELDWGDPSVGEGWVWGV